MSNNGFFHMRNSLQMKRKILFSFVFPVFFFSCMTHPKNVVYFQDLNNYQQNIPIGNYSIAYDPVIQKNDELLITVMSPTLNQEAVAQFNLPPVSFLAAGETNIQKSPIIQTYIVDSEGAIDFPVIGRISLAGMKKSQAIELMKDSISKHIEEPVIVLRIISFRVTVLGEVRMPGTKYAGKERMSILDAIGDAGDLTIYGDRKNVWLIRENDNGAINHIPFDLTSAELFTSPYYYLQQNDKIIVQPNRAKQLESKYGTADGYRLSIYSMAFGVLSIITSTTLAIISLGKK